MTTHTPEKIQSTQERQIPKFFAHILRRRKKAGWQAFINKARQNTDVAHINDCEDSGARLRLGNRSAEILGRNAAFAGPTNDLEAAGLLIDALDALDAAVDSKNRTHKSIILVNVAPRNGDAKKYENGTPFCYFYYKGALVVATIDGLTLSLLKKFKLIDSVQVIDVPTVLPILKKEGMISEGKEKRIRETQFRSYEFTPRLALYLSRRGDILSERKDINEIPDAPHAAWYVDSFATYGNVKTTILPEDVFSSDVIRQLKSGASVKNKIASLDTKFGTLPVYRRLKDVPNGRLAVIQGSSGLGDKRFLEIVVQGGSAGKELGIKVGDSIF